MHIRLRKWVKILLFFIIFSGLLFCYSKYIEPKLFKVKEYSINDNNIPQNFNGFKIVQISDIHYNNTTTYKDFKKIINKINSLKPDLIILTGDLLNKNIKYSTKDYNNIKKLLKELDANIEKIAIKGDNDTNSNWNDIISYSNFIDLNNNIEEIYYKGIDPILICGITNKNEIENTINKINNNYKYSILITHTPDLIDNIDINNFNLILAGHSLNGQIVIPYYGGIIKAKGATKYYNSFYQLKNTKLYISSGIGNDKYKFRLFNIPSINFFRLKTS